MFIKEYRHGFRTLYFVTQVKDDKYFYALFRFDSLNRQMFLTFKEPLKLSLVFISIKHMTSV